MKRLLPHGALTARDCQFRSDKAAKQLLTMTVLNSSDDERDLTRLAVELWKHRADEAMRNGGTWRHESEPLWKILEENAKAEGRE